MSEKVIHFGEFIRWHRIQARKTTEEFGRELGITARRLIALEAMAKPDVQHTTIVAISQALGIDPEKFDETWRSTPVPSLKRKSGPTTDEARRFGAACAAAGVSQAEGLRRLRSWLVAQDSETQQAALTFEATNRSRTVQSLSTFTDPVDHLQDPGEETAKRVAKKANLSGTKPGSAATGENKHR